MILVADGPSNVCTYWILHVHILTICVAGLNFKCWPCFMDISILLDRASPGLHNYAGGGGEGLLPAYEVNSLVSNCEHYTRISHWHACNFTWKGAWPLSVYQVCNSSQHLLLDKNTTQVCAKLSSKTLFFFFFTYKLMPNVHSNSMFMCLYSFKIPCTWSPDHARTYMYMYQHVHTRIRY